MCIPGLRGRAKDIRRVADGAQAYAAAGWVTDPSPEDLFLSLDREGIQTVILPPTPDYVLKFNLTD